MKRICKLLSCLILLMFASGMVKGQDFVRYESALEGSAFRTDSTDSVGDAYIYTELGINIDSDYLIKDVISLEIKDNETVVFPDSFQCVVKIAVFAYDILGHETTTYKILRVTYNDRALVHDTLRSFYLFYNKYKVKDSIVSITATGISDTVSIFRLVNSIEIQRQFSPSLCSSSSITSVTPSYLAEQDELQVQWQVASSDSLGLYYDACDLEWTFYDDYSAWVRNAGIITNMYNDAAFQNNSTRVEVRENIYQIPLIYEQGWILYRIRPVKILPNQQRIPGEWTSTIYGNSPGAYPFMYQIAGHEDSLNWQSKTSYAEEGKRKSVVSYFDGASKNRQSVTKITTDTMAIVAQTIYDDEGRPVVNTLPAPAFQQLIKYFDKFNQNTSGQSYNWLNADSSNDCEHAPGIMNPASGSSLYYSPNNPLKAIGYNQYIPNAFSYPFSQQIYTPDLTGRIQFSAGPGLYHHMGTNHITQYLYAQPDQGELDSLFGKEVGVYTHYFKNATIDPNGQVTVTYTDMHGRTIATALSGAAQYASMDTLSEWKVDTITDAILDTTNNYIDYSTNSIICTKTFMVLNSPTTPYYFKYCLFPPSDSIYACSTQFCFDCIYNLTIRITDDCNNQKLGGQPYVVSLENVSFSGSAPQYDTLCSNPANPFIDSFSIALPPGTYTVTKTLTISDSAINYYYNYYITRDTCLKTFQSFYSNALSQLDLSGCNMTCASCEAALGDSATFLTKYIDSIIAENDTVPSTHQDTLNAFYAYNTLKSYCDLLCDSVGICQQRMLLMLNDMSPTGRQYATYDGTYSSTDSTSIFCSASYVILTNAIGTHPVLPIYKDPAIVYLNALGVPDTLIIDTSGIGVWDTLTPNQLSVQNFIQYWKPSWANALLPYHPEYCYYEFCEANSASNDYDSWLLSVTQFDTAMFYGLMNPLEDVSGACPFGTSANPDPFFSTTGFGTTDYAAVYQKMHLFMDTTGFSDTDHVATIWQICSQMISTDSPAHCNKCMQNYYWNAFRSMYLGIKQPWVDAAMAAWVAVPANCNKAAVNFTIAPLLGKTQRFEPASDSLWAGANNTDTVALVNQGEAILQADSAGLGFTCHNYASYWWGQLQGCSIPQADSALIINEMIAVCNLGSSSSTGHPYGASTSPDSSDKTTHGNWTFEGVLRWASRASQPDTGGWVAWTYSPSALCTSCLINNPLPYSVVVSYYEGATATKPDTCTCNKILNYYQAYLNYGDTVHLNFASYVDSTFGIITDSASAMVLVHSCKDTCPYTVYPVEIPYKFSCVEHCVSCSEVVGYYHAFLDSFPGVTSSPNYMTLAQSFMNAAVGFNITTLEYLNFMNDSCGYNAFPIDTIPPVTCQPPPGSNLSESVYMGCSTSIAVYNDTACVGCQVNVIYVGIGTATATGNMVNYMNQGSYVPNDTVTYTVCNTCYVCDTAHVYINITNTVCHNAPVAFNHTYYLCVRDSQTYLPLQGDYEADGGPFWLKGIDTSSPNRAYVSGNDIMYHASADTGIDSFSYIICNPASLCDTATIYVHVTSCSEQDPMEVRRPRTTAPLVAAKPFTIFASKQNAVPIGNSRRTMPAITKWKPANVTIPQGVKYGPLARYLMAHSKGLYRPSINKKTWLVHPLFEPATTMSNEWLDQLLRNKLKKESPPTKKSATVRFSDPIWQNIYKRMHQPIIDSAQGHSAADILLAKALSGKPLSGQNANHQSIVNYFLNNKDVRARAIGAVLSRPKKTDEREKLKKDDENKLATAYKTYKNRQAAWTAARLKAGAYLAEITEARASAMERTASAINALNIKRQESEVRAYNLQNNKLPSKAYNPLLGSESLSVSALASRAHPGIPFVMQSTSGNSPHGERRGPMSSGECDSLSRAINLYDSLYGESSVSSYYGFLNFLFDSLGVYQDFPIWQSDIASCSLSCPEFFNCSAVSDLMETFEASHPMFVTSCPSFIWATYLNDHIGSVFYGPPIPAVLNSTEWTAILNCCGVGVLPNDTLANYCDSVTAINSLCSFGQLGTMACLQTNLNKVFINRYDTLTGQYGDAAYWIRQFSNCGIACSDVLPCSEYSSLLSSFKTENPAFADSCPITIWVNYMNATTSSSFRVTDWTAMLGCCSIPYPTPDTLHSLCDSVAAAVATYNSISGSTTTNLNTFEETMGSFFGYDHPESYWFGLLDSCHISCPVIINCGLTDSMLNSLKTSYPTHDTIPDFVWVSYLNDSASRGGNYYTPAQWTLLLHCCGYAPPVPDTLKSLCDSLQAMDNFFKHQILQNPANQTYWVFQGDLGLFFGAGRYDNLGNWHPVTDFNYWLNLYTACNINTDLINCTEIDSALTAFFTQNPEFHDTVPDFMWTNYLSNYVQGNYTTAEFRLLLQGCGISVPPVDSAATLCDSLAGVINYYNYQSNLNSNQSIGSFLQATGTFIAWTDHLGNEYDYTHWYPLIDSCHITCPYIINCHIADSLLAVLDSVLPGDSCPAWIWVDYLNNNNGVGFGQAYTSGQYDTLLACCGAGVPISGIGFATHCDSMAVVEVFLQNYQSMLSNKLDGTCAPAWLWDALVISQDNFLQPYGSISTICPQLAGCGYDCVDTCVFHTYCDSLNNLWRVVNILNGGGNGFQRNLTSIYDGLFNSTDNFGQILLLADSCGAINLCDSTLGPVITALQPLFNQYADSCMQPMIFSQLMYDVIGLDLPYSNWATLAARCDWTMPPFCNNTLYSLCDTVGAIDGLYWAGVNSLGGTDSTSFFASNLSILLGYTVSGAQADSLIAACNGSMACSGITTFNDSLTSFLSPDTCYPAWFYEFMWGSELAGGGGAKAPYSTICDTLTHCGLSCPDTCGALGNTHCDTVQAIYQIFRQTVNTSLGIDSFSLALFLMGDMGYSFPGDLLGPGYRGPYDSMIDMYYACTNPPCSLINPLVSTIMADTGNYANGLIPISVVSYFLNFESGLDLSAGQWVNAIKACGDTLRVDTSTVGTFCDSVAMATELFAALNDANSDTDSIGPYLADAFNIVFGYYPNNHYSGTQAVGLLTQCFPGAICLFTRYTHYIPQTIFAYEASHGLHVGTTVTGNQATFYAYMDSLYGVWGFDWCDSFSNCGLIERPRRISTDPGPITITCAFDTIPTPEKYLCNRPLWPPIQPQTDDSCMQQMQQYAFNNATMQYNYYIQAVHDSFVDGYVTKCLGAYRLEHFKYTHPDNEFHFTLYYYDQAGNLVQTVPPNGAIPDSFPHTYLTKYRYNTQNQVIEQVTPDAGYSYFWYDRILKLTFSQNAKQANLNQLSYTRYDPIQRITEVGRIDDVADAIPNYYSIDTTAQDSNWYVHLLYTRPAKEVTHTYYDDDQLGIAAHFTGTGMANLRNRVASVTYTDTLYADSTKYNAGTHYSYDVDGNVQTLLQENRNLKPIHQDFKRLDYQYDLISGKVNAVMYQRGKPDAFYHVYNYDADNRITDVYTSRDSIFFDHDAFYQYYLHGPLARTVIGEKQVQGVNYAYTLQGWLKGINGDKTNRTSLMGQDGQAGTLNDLVGVDYYGFSLGYFTGDYSPIGNLNANGNPFVTDGPLASRDLFNGNISRMKEFNSGLTTNPLGGGIDTAIAYNYHYDQLNRLTNMNAATYLYNPADSSVAYTTMPDYGEHVVYDPNGNILNYFRNGTTANGGPLGMDSLTYKYQHGNNKLDHVNDAVTSTNYSVDIDNEDTLNYNYDQIGNLTKDSAAGIDSIYWTVYGKIWKIVKFNGDIIKFHYGPDGNRIAKEVFKDTLHTWTNTYYVHDATGNIMATYQWKNKDTFSLDELMMYGSSRLGTVGVNEYLTDTAAHDSAWYAQCALLSNPNADTTIVYYSDGLKQYELTNHLGNVLLTLTDRHIPVYVSGTFSLYKPEVASAQDYYPFGQVMPGRQFTSTNYRYGFNGKEKDDEVKGAGNQIDYGMRGYDPRLGRFLSVDPLFRKYPWYSTYQFAGNKPIWKIDIDGLEEWWSPGTPNTFYGPYSSEYVQATGLKPVIEIHGGVTGHLPADEVNAGLLQTRGWTQPAYQSGTMVTTFKNNPNTNYVRLIYETPGAKFPTNNPQGDFVANAKDLEGLTPEQIQNGLALPGKPTGFKTVNPGEANMQTGIAGKNEFGEGGIRQYQIMDELDPKSFSAETNNMPEVFPSTQAPLETAPPATPSSTPIETTPTEVSPVDPIEPIEPILPP